MDQVTKGKFRILGSDYHEELLAAIDESNIPPEYGGTMETRWHWPYPEGSGCSPSEIEKYRHQAEGSDEDEKKRGTTAGTESLGDSTLSGGLEDVS